ncbi:MAG: HAMP domain-containing histidine kinase [Clostridia bacterium]|nr:HAMP domain-containing histidine kinase [Clostridia bacterium]
MSRMHKEVTLSAEAEGQSPAPQAAQGKEITINRLSDWVHGLLVNAVSHMRLSLTLRIAFHFVGQLLRTTIPVLLAVMVALCCMEIPFARESLYRVAAIDPAQPLIYEETQLTGTGADGAYLTETPMPAGLDGFSQRLKLGWNSFFQEGRDSVRIYCDSHRGGLVVDYSLDRLIRSATVLFWVILCADLLRSLYLVNHSNRLNKKVLKPISDMAETAATLSANNLSDRISVEGAKNELKDLALVINGMLDRIELSYNSQKQFVSDASHELRTPIAVIQGYVSMLERWGKTDKEILDEGIAAISQEAASMKELVERLLFLARHDKKTLMLEMEVFDPLEVMSELHREAKMLSTAHEFALEPAENALINGDKGMIKQLMRVLVDNAIKYTPEGGKITLGMRKEGRQCILSVTDTGSGIAPENLTRVFDRFFRCDEARKAQSSGHGLGLSIARIIAVAHGGKIRVRSKVDVGTTFSVLLPTEE